MEFTSCILTKMETVFVHRANCFYLFLFDGNKGTRDVYE